MTRDSKSVAAQRMREYRKRKKDKEIKETMANLKINKKEAEDIVIKNDRKDNTEQRAYNRLKFKDKKVKTISDKRAVNVSSGDAGQEDEKDLKLKVSKFIILQDDKDAWRKLTSVEKLLIDKMHIMGGYGKVRTLIQYLNKVKGVYKKLGKNLRELDINVLTDTKVVIKLLDNYKGKKDYYSAIITVLKAYKEYEEYIKIYEKEMKRGISLVVEEQKKNMKTQAQKDNWLKYDKVLSLFKTNKKMLNDKDRLLLTLIIYYPRRVQDWQKMRLHKKGTKDNNFNYLNINKDKNPTTFDFLRSKSQEYEKLGVNQQIPNSVKGFIREYLRDKQINNNQLLFSNDDGTMYSTDAFSKKIRKLFFLITSKDITSNTWRHIVATNLTNKKVSLNKREKVANQMGHSILQSLLYSKHK